MDFCGLSAEFLADAVHWCSYDENIPFQYRVIARLLYEHAYEMVKKIMEANPDAFENAYRYLILDMAIEFSTNYVVNEAGKVIDADTDLYGMRNLRPTPETLDFIVYLLEHGADPNLPAHFNQMEHITDAETDGSQQCGCELDCSEIKRILETVDTISTT